jgi:hypothetical protein
MTDQEILRLAEDAQVLSIGEPDTLVRFARAILSHKPHKPHFDKKAGYWKMLALLSRKPVSVSDIADLIYVSRGTARLWVKHAEANGQVKAHSYCRAANGGKVMLYTATGG